ncbi:putative E3 ubiquitin-protein ligase UBR7 isoform X1 [Zingiber officinale]|uniref:putative E3 ubiquitin-protein ligase UBR7 isoform X1 n=2 Tax=Zingiber officinale TaxID=94328 RepID=UPI001C4B5A1B|nr:putative E3 ubiquitin-protein ligase UBR7 isoform X1 [Zingiber officinale]
MADASEDETEQTVTIGEYIEELEAEELEADLVLGGDEGKECTYPGGYMKRQAIFSCLTCVPSGNAGVCTACSLSCHDGHEVVELWTKRKFRCDCGNSKFGEFSCKLHPDKEPENTGNSYNQNFRGCYCTCGRPYPDPDAKEQIEMIQCCICEDWFHENHLGLNSLDKIPRDEDGEPVYDDFVCEKCASIFSFLKLYPSSIWALPKQKNVPSVQSGTENMVENGSSTNCSDKAIGSHISQSVIHESSSGNDSTCENGTVINATSDNNKVCLEDQGSSATCTIGVDINVLSVSSEKIGPMFLLKKWRELLCKCRTCSEFYTHKGVEFLTDKEDTIEEYEKMAKSKREEKLKQQEGAELNFLNTLNHVQKIEIFSGIADMKNELHSFLESFDSSKPVTSDDIKGVFENLAKKKKQRLA